MQKLLEKIQNKYGDEFMNEFSIVTDTYIKDLEQLLRTTLMDKNEEYKNAVNKFNNMVDSAFGKDTPLRVEFNETARKVEENISKELLLLGIMIGTNL